MRTGLNVRGLYNAGKMAFFSFLLFFDRYMLGIASLPSVIMVVGFLLLPESPRWLVKTGKLERARYVLEKLHLPEDVENELTAIRKICDQDDVKKLEAGIPMWFVHFDT